MAALVLVAACGTLDPVDGPRAELDQARALWEDFEPSNYTYSVRRLCFCAPDAIGPVRVVVQDGVVSSAAYVATGDTVATTFRDLFPAVEGLFDVLENAYDTEADGVEVTFDDDTGVPTQFFIDFIEMAADDELGYEITEPVTVVLPQ